MNGAAGSSRDGVGRYLERYGDDLDAQSRAHQGAARDARISGAAHGRHARRARARYRERDEPAGRRARGDAADDPPGVRDARRAERRAGRRADSLTHRTSVRLIPAAAPGPFATRAATRGRRTTAGSPDT